MRSRRPAGARRDAEHYGAPKRSKVNTQVNPEFWPLLLNFTLVPGVSTGLHWLLVQNEATATPTAVSFGTMLTTGISVGLTGWTWSHFGCRNRELRAHATLTVGWLTWATTILAATGPWHWPWGMAWVAGGLLTGGYWIIRDWARNLGKAAGEGGGGSDTNHEIAALATLAKAKASKGQVDDRGKATVRLALPPGAVARKELDDAPGAIASFNDLPTSGVRMIPVPGQPRAVDVEIETVDHLAVDRRWPGAAALGESAGKAYRAGYDSSGVDRMVDVTGCDRDMSSDHILLTGMNGSGKTDSAIGGVVQEALVRVDTIDGRPYSPLVIVLDPAKKGQSYAHLGPHVWLETDPKRCNQVMRAFAQVIPDRTEHLGRHGYMAWRPGCGLSYLFAVLEEAHEYLPSGKYDGVIRTIRSSGGSVLTSTQRATWDSVTTLWRGQHDISWCFGVNDDDDADFGLNPSMRGLVHPEEWGKRKPGCSYLGGANVTDEDSLRPIRAYSIHKHRVEIAEYVTGWRQHHGVSLEMDPVTLGPLAGLFETRPTFDAPPGSGPVVLVTRPDASPVHPLPVIESTAVEEIEEPDEDADEIAAEAGELDEELTHELADELDEEAAGMDEAECAALAEVDMTTSPEGDDELPVVDDLGEIDAALREEFGEDEQPARRLGSGEMVCAWLDWVGASYTAGERVLARPDAVAWAARHGRADSWVDGKLAELVRDGYARRGDRGRYQLLGVPANEAGEFFADIAS